MLDRVQDRALAGPPKDIQRLVPKPLLHCLGCVLRVVVLLEVEPTPQSEVMSTLEQVFIKNLSKLCSVHLCLDPDWSPSLCRWKTPSQHDAATSMLGARVHPDMMLGIQKEFNLGFIRPEKPFSHGLWVFRCLLANSKWAVMCLLLRSGLSLATLPKGLIGGVPQRWFSICKVLPSPQSNCRALSEWLLDYWSPPWPRPFSPDCSVWPGGQL